MLLRMARSAILCLVCVFVYVGCGVRPQLDGCVCVESCVGLHLVKVLSVEAVGSSRDSHWRWLDGAHCFDSTKATVQCF